MTDTLYNRIWETVGKKVGYGVDCDALTDALMDIFNEEKKKEVVRAYILEKLRNVTSIELDELYLNHGLESSFHTDETFEHEVYRIEKLFNFPANLPPHQ